MLFNLLSKDHFELGKLRLKKDAEFLNQLIVISEEGELLLRKELLYIHKKESEVESSRSSEVEDNFDEHEISEVSISKNESHFNKAEDNHIDSIYESEQSSLIDANTKINSL